jgi:Plasmid encoded RepA protein
MEPPTNLQRRIVDASLTIADFGTDRPEFLHAVLCQVGLPRSRQDARTFERHSGNASLLLEAGQRATGLGKWQECPLPYGAQPRLVLYHLCSEAIRTQSNVVDVGGSVREFLRRVGVSVGGKEFNRFKEQMTALSCCRMTLAYVAPNGRVSQMQATPIDSFDAWLHPNPDQGSFWPDVIELHAKFFSTLLEHAVPLDPRAIGALQHSALALDVYTWLAHRLCRVRKAEGVKLSWANLRQQFGQEYACSKDFKKVFKAALLKVCAVYPGARISDEIGGIRLYPSPAPVPKSQVLVQLPAG